MNFSNADKQAIINEQARILAKVTLISTGDVFTEDTSLSSFDYEDFRYVPNQGFIGQFVQRLMDISLKSAVADETLVDQEINVQIGVDNRNTSTTTYYDVGNFIVTKVGDVDTNGNVTIQSADYTKKFNVAYDSDESTFPILAGHLAVDICNYVGVPLDDCINVVYYIHQSDTPLAVGTYNMVSGSTTYKFTTTLALNKNDVILIKISSNQIIQRTVNQTTGEVTRTTLSTSSSTGTSLTGVTAICGNFTNNDFVVEEWPFTVRDAARRAMSDIGKLAYSWVRVGEDNKVHIDFTQMTQSSVSQYDIITTDNYYELTTEPKYIGPINRISLGLSDITGEEVYKDAPGTHEEIYELEINDNAFAGSDILRKIALNGCERLFGLTYVPLNVVTTGHPWLKADELIKVQKLDGTYVYTYPLDRELDYKGFIKSTITSSGKNKVQTEYEFKDDITTSIKNAEINVNKATGQIALLTNEVYPNGIESESAIKMNADAIDLEVNTNRDAAINGAINDYDQNTVQAGLALKVSTSTYNTDQTAIDNKFAGTTSTGLSQSIAGKVDTSTYNNNNTVINNKFAGITETGLSQRIEAAESAVVLKATAHGALVTAALTADPATGSAFTVLADNIDLSGKTINLTSDNINIVSDNFSVDSDGTMTCRNSSIIGDVQTTAGFTFDEDGLNIYKDEESYNTLIDDSGMYSKYGSTTVLAEFTRNGAKIKDLDIYGYNKYGEDDIDSNPLFIAVKYYNSTTQEYGYGHFYNG